MYFTRERSLYHEGFVNVYIERKNECGYILEDYKMDLDIVDAVLELNANILSNKAQFKDEDIAFIDVCSKWFGQCAYDQNYKLLDDMVNYDPRVTYPYHTHSNGTIFQSNTVFGGVQLDQNNTILNANALMFTYHVRFMEDSDKERSTAWLNEVRDYLLDYRDSRIDIYFMTSLTLAQEIVGV